MASAYDLAGRDIVGLILLVVCVLVPVAFAARSGRTSKPGLPECPDCGALNPANETSCYCCGHVFKLPKSHGVPASVIQMVRQADADKAKQPTPAHSPPVSKVA